MRNFLLAGATIATLALCGGGAWAGDRVPGSSPYRVIEPQSGDFQKAPHEKPDPAIQDGRAVAVAQVPGEKSNEPQPIPPH
jgi:hypothetical protein